MESPTVFVVIVMEIDGDVTDVVGPFWYEDSAERFAVSVERRHNKRCRVRRMVERGVWEAEHK